MPKRATRKEKVICSSLIFWRPCFAHRFFFRHQLSDYEKGEKKMNILSWTPQNLGSSPVRSEVSELRTGRSKKIVLLNIRAFKKIKLIFKTISSAPSPLWKVLRFTLLLCLALLGTECDPNVSPHGVVLLGVRRRLDYCWSSSRPTFRGRSPSWRPTRRWTWRHPCVDRRRWQ